MYVLFDKGKESEKEREGERERDRERREIFRREGLERHLIMPTLKALII